MKYIRTKNAIIPDKDKYLQDLDIEQYSMYMQGLLKEADTIEELCDEFICKFEDEKTPFITYKWYLGECQKREEFGGNAKTKIKCEIYGAIWTDKGLIYVAKMNEKGELELL